MYITVERILKKNGEKLTTFERNKKIGKFTIGKKVANMLETLT